MTRRFAAIAIALFTTVGLPATVSAQSYPSTGSAVFSDATPEAGNSITISGTTTPDTSVLVTLDGGPAVGANVALARVVLGSTMSDATGAFSLSVTVPAGLSNGAYTMAVVAGSTVISSTNFSIGAVATAAPQGSGTPAPAQTTAAGQLPVTGGDSSTVAIIGAGFVFVGGLALAGTKLRTQP